MINHGSDSNPPHPPQNLTLNNNNHNAGIVDATYTWAVLPVSKTCYRIARLISTAINALLVRPALAVARWWWALIVPPVAAALLWLWGGICAVPGWAWCVSGSVGLGGSAGRWTIDFDRWK